MDPLLAGGRAPGKTEFLQKSQKSDGRGTSDVTDETRTFREYFLDVPQAGGPDGHYLLDEGPMVRPKLISPLSMRILNPQPGLEHTQAL
jgi:hypothetical protein